MFKRLLSTKFSVAFVNRVEKEMDVTAVVAAGPIDTFKRYDRRETMDNATKRPTVANGSGAKKKSKLAHVDRSGMKSLTSFFGKK